MEIKVQFGDEAGFMFSVPDVAWYRLQARSASVGKMPSELCSEFLHAWFLAILREA